jgi:hypothetical protein
MDNSKRVSIKTSTELTITNQGKQKLTKNQEEFNKLTKRIEKLQKEIEKKHFQFDEALKLYGTDLYPLQQKVVEKRRALITVLWEIHLAKKLSKADQRHLKDILRNNIEEFFEVNEEEIDKELKEIISKLDAINFDIMEKEQMELMKEELQNIFDNENLDINVDDIDINDKEALAKKVMEAKMKMMEQEALNEEKRQKKQAAKKKSPKELAREKMQQEADELKQKNIGTVYKQLAKLFHPDLEQDPEKKLEKEILMKELTAAYESKNLHALLTLELRWIHNENNNLESLTDEKLSVYLHILKEQASDLERQKILIFQLPKYYVLLEEFGYEIQRNAPLNVINHYLKQVKDTNIIFQNDIDQLQSDIGLRYMKKMIQEWKIRKREMQFDDDFFGHYMDY